MSGGLVNSNKNKKTISRGQPIVPEKTFSSDQLIPKKDKQEVKTSFAYEPKPTTLKIDTKIRDQINTLSLIGFGDTQKETIELLINNILDSMTFDEKRKFDIQYQVLEDKTIKTINKKR